MKVYSRRNSNLRGKTFWISASKKSFYFRNKNIKSRRQDVKTFKGTGSGVIGEVSRIVTAALFMC